MAPILWVGLLMVVFGVLIGLSILARARRHRLWFVPLVVLGALILFPFVLVWLHFARGGRL